MTTERIDPIPTCPACHTTDLTLVPIEVNDESRDTYLCDNCSTWWWPIEVMKAGEEAAWARASAIGEARKESEDGYRR